GRQDSVLVTTDRRGHWTCAIADGQGSRARDRTPRARSPASRYDGRRSARDRAPRRAAPTRLTAARTRPASRARRLSLARAFPARAPFPARVRSGKVRTCKEDPAMADTIRVVEYFYVETPNTPGVGAGMLTTLRDARVNLLAFSGFPSGRRAQIDFVP